MTLQTWIIEPRDSLIVRDGKPFGANITQATSLDFPFPSTTTGGVRTRAGLDSLTRIFRANPNDVKTIGVCGSLLAQIDDNGEIKEFYLPSPADALIVQDDKQKVENKAQLYRLLPLDLSDAFNNLNDLLPVGLNRTDMKDKPYNDLAFWNWTSSKNWQLHGSESTSISLEGFGIKKLQKDSRTHVAINLDMASDDGDLFSTRGLEFNYGSGDLSNTKKLALAVFVDDANSKKLENKGNLAPLGGERRLVTWREDKKQHHILTCPDEIKKRIVADKHCRLMLLTPAYFDDIFNQIKRTDSVIKAIACNRYQTVSGWEFKDDCPKPTRRLLPAGSILFLKLNENTDIEKWIKTTWFTCIGDDPQAVKDGFGLSILGTWDGKPLTEWRKEDENAKN